MRLYYKYWTTTYNQEGADVLAPNLPVVVQGEVLDSQSALDAEARVKEALRDGKQALWKLSKALYDFDTSKGWAALGYENLSQWLNDPEIDMTRGTYYRWVNTWRKWVVEKGVKPAQLEQVSASKAALVADDVVAGSVRPSTAIKDVQTLSANQLREKYEKPRRGRPPASESENGATRARRASRSNESEALRAAAQLPWDFIEGAMGEGNLDLRKARLREALGALVEWRATYLLAE